MHPLLKILDKRSEAEFELAVAPFASVRATWPAAVLNQAKGLSTTQRTLPVNTITEPDAELHTGKMQNANLKN